MTQEAAILTTLKGAASEIAQEIPPDVVIRGGTINGVAVDPVTYVMHLLAERYAQLGEEAHLTVMNEIMTFHRNSGEKTDDLIHRFEILRVRASQQAGMQMPVNAYTWLLLKAVGINNNQLISLIEPYGGRLPTTNANYQDMLKKLRRMSHIIEGAPGNLGSHITRGSSSGSERQHAFLNVSDTDNQRNWSTSSNQWTWDDRSWNDSSTWHNDSNAWHENVSSAFWTGSPPEESLWPSQEQNEYMDEEEFYESGTDTDTSSSCGDHDYNMDNIPPGDDNTRAQYLYWLYSHAKKRWRSFTGKPVRRLRRFFRKPKGKGGKGKGKGKMKSSHAFGKGKPRVNYAFLADYTQHDLE